MAVNDLLTEAEISALLYGIDNTAGDGTGRKLGNNQDPSIYVKNVQFIRNFIPEIDIICERYIVYMRDYLKNYLHQNIEISINNVILEKYIDYINSLSIPSSIACLSSRENDSKFLLHMDTNIAYLIIDHYFGGSGKYSSVINKQEFTELECQVLNGISINAVSKLEKSWNPICPMKLDLLSTIHDMQSKNILDTDEIVGVIRFKIESDSIEGYFDLVIPHSSLKNLKNYLEFKSNKR